MSDAQTLSVYAKRADEYDTLVAGDSPDEDLQRFIANVNAGGHVLDIGCGPGVSAGFMAAAGLRVDAWDPVPEMIALVNARAETHAGITARQAGYDDLTVPGRYDGIWANFSLLHMPLTKWPDYLAAIQRALKPGGHFHFGTKLGHGEIRDSIGRLYSYMEATPLRALLAQTGFTLTYERTGEEAGLSGEVAPFIIVQGHT